MVSRTSLLDLLAVPAGAGYSLSSSDPRSTPLLQGGKKAGLAELRSEGGELASLQERLYAAGSTGASRQALLVVLQGIDTAGKDGTVKHVIGLVNPSGTRITSFRAPTEEERRHHFLWRIRAELPAPGIIGIFNRSHYEDVLVPTVSSSLPAAALSRRYDEINSFEAGLLADGVCLLKIFLHISYDEQRSRLLERLRDPSKRWKFSPSDLEARARWPAYTAAYETMFLRCSPAVAPWYVVPADRKWYRNWAVSMLLRETLLRMDPRYPSPSLDVPALEARLLSS